MKNTQNNNKKRGVVLIIALLLMATISAILFAGSFAAQNQLRTSKLTEEKEKAQQKAQTALEDALQRGEAAVTNGTSNLPSVERTVNTNTVQSVDIGPMKVGDSYTLYLVPYSTNMSGTSVARGSATLRSIKNVPSGAYVEITTIGAGAEAEKYIVANGDVKPSSFGSITTGKSVINQDGDLSDTLTLTGKIAFIRLVKPSNLVQQDATDYTLVLGGGGLIEQGVFVKASTVEGTTDITATTNEIYQSYPQIPNGFAITGL
jgi:Tfp pilus assembly protein PilX